MCCREGLDNPPKSSTKTPFTKSNTSKASSKPAESTSRGKVGTKLPILHKSQKPTGRSATIERVDLTSRGMPGDHSKIPPQKPESLNSLHRNAQNAAPVDLPKHKKPSFSYTTGTRPGLSFLGESQKTSQQLEISLSDYDDSWMDDLPSPSALTIQENPTSTKLPPISAADIPGINNEDSISELEACMVGLDDSVALAGNEAGGARHGRGFASKYGAIQVESTSNLPVNWSSSPNDIPLTNSRAERDPGGRSRSQRLFMSTDSPDKSDTSPIDRTRGGKRTLEGLISSQQLLDELPPAKRRRLSIHEEPRDSGTLVPSMNSENMSGREAEKAGKPGWEGIDPSFIAEYGDIVEIVESV